MWLFPHHSRLSPVKLMFRRWIKSSGFSIEMLIARRPRKHLLLMVHGMLIGTTMNFTTAGEKNE